MAKDEKNIKVKDEFDLGEDFDFDNFDSDFGSQSNVKTNSNPNQRAAMDFTAGVKESIMDMVKTPNLKEVGEFAKDALPSDVSYNLSGLFDLPDKVSETIGQNMGPLKSELRETTRIINQFLPKGGMLENWMKKIDEKLSDEEDYREQQESREQQQAAAIAGAITEAMGDISQRQQASDAIRTQVETQHYANTNNILIKLLGSSESIRHFNSEVTDKYFRKSLELQFQQLYTAKEQTEVLKVGMDTIKAQLENVVKNTSLPDLIKLRSSERFGETISNRFRESVADVLYGDWNPLVRFQKNITGRIRDTMQGFTDSLSMANSMGSQLEMLNMMDDMPGESKAKMLGSLGGGFITDWVRKQLAQKVGGKFGNTFVGKKLFAGMTDMGADFTQFVDDAYTNTKGSKSLLGKGVNKLLGITKGFTSRNYMKTVDFQREDLNAPVAFDGLTRASIVKVIPSLLTKIYGEIATLRTSKGIKEVSKSFDIIYDFDKGTHVQADVYVENRLKQHKTKVSNNVGWDLDRVIDIVMSIPGRVDKKGTPIPVIGAEALPNKQKILKNAIRNYLIDGGGISSKILYDGKLTNYIKYEEKRAGIPGGLSSALISGKKLIQNYFENNRYEQDSFVRALNSIKANLASPNSLAKDLERTGNLDKLASMTVKHQDGTVGRVYDYNENYNQYYQDAESTKEYMKNMLRDGKYDKEGYRIAREKAEAAKEKLLDPFKQVSETLGGLKTKAADRLKNTDLYKGVVGTMTGLRDVGYKHLGKGFDKFKNSKFIQKPQIQEFLNAVGNALDQSPDLTAAELERQAKQLYADAKESGIGKAIQEGEFIKFCKEAAKNKGKLVKEKAINIYDTKIKNITPADVVNKIKQLTDKETIIATAKDIANKITNSELAQDVASLPEIKKLREKADELKKASGAKAKKLEKELKELMGKHTPKLLKKLEEAEKKGVKGTVTDIKDAVAGSKVGGFFSRFFGKIAGSEFYKNSKTKLDTLATNSLEKLQAKYDAVKDKTVHDALLNAKDLSNKAKGKLVAFYKDPIGTLKSKLNLKEWATDKVAQKLGLDTTVVENALSGDQEALKTVHSALESFNAAKGEAAKEKKLGFRIPGKSLAYSSAVNTVAAALRVTRKVDRWLARKMRSGIKTVLKMGLAAPLLLLKAPVMLFKGIWKLGKFAMDVRKRMSALDKQASLTTDETVKTMTESAQALTGEQGIIGRIMSTGFGGIMGMMSYLGNRIGGSTDAIAGNTQASLEAAANELEEKMNDKKEAEKKAKEEAKEKEKQERDAKEKANADRDGSGDRDGSAKSRRGLFAKIKNAGGKLKDVVKEKKDSLANLLPLALAAAGGFLKKIWGGIKFVGKSVFLGLKGIKWLLWDMPGKIIKGIGSALNWIGGLFKSKKAVETAATAATAAKSGGLLSKIGSGIAAAGSWVANTKVGKWIGETAKPIINAITKYGKPAWEMAKKLFSGWSSSCNMLLGRLKKRLAKSALTKILGKIGSKLVPGIGWIMIGATLIEAAYYIIAQKTPVLSAISIALLGFDLFSSDQPVDPETGEPLEVNTEEDTTNASDKRKELIENVKKTTGGNPYFSIGVSEKHLKHDYDVDENGNLELKVAGEAKVGKSDMTDKEILERGPILPKCIVDVLRNLKFDPIKISYLNDKILEHNKRYAELMKKENPKFELKPIYTYNSLSNLRTVLIINKEDQGIKRVFAIYKLDDGNYEEKQYNLYKNGASEYENWVARAGTMKWNEVAAFKKGVDERFLEATRLMTPEEYLARKEELKRIASGKTNKPSKPYVNKSMTEGYGFDVKADGSADFNYTQEKSGGNPFGSGSSKPHYGGGITPVQPHGGYNAASVAAPKEGANRGYVLELLDDVAKKFGLDPVMFKAMAAQESGLKSNAKAKGSSASGLFQFIRDTWRTMIAKYGKQYGYGPNTSPFDPKANALMAAHYISDNIRSLKGSVKNVGPVEAYMAHFLGTGGARKFLTANPNEPSYLGFEKAAKANPAIFRPGTTKADIYNAMGAKLNNAVTSFGIGVNNGGTGTTLTKEDVAGIPGDHVVQNDITLEELKTINNTNYNGSSPGGQQSMDNGYSSPGGNKPVNNVDFMRDMKMSDGGVDFKAYLDAAGGGGDGKEMALPTKSNVVTSRFGPRKTAGIKGGASKNHKGIDLRAHAGEPITAMRSGTVVSAGGPYGAVEVNHGDGYSSKYLHLLKTTVRPGTFVKAGDVVGVAGGRGPSGAYQYTPHLHLSVLKDNQPIDPEKVLRAGGIGLSLKGGGDLPPLSDTGTTVTNVTADNVPDEWKNVELNTKEYGDLIRSIQTDTTLTGEERGRKLSELYKYMKSKSGSAKADEKANAISPEQRTESKLAKGMPAGSSAVETLDNVKQEIQQQQNANAAQAGSWEASKTNVSLDSVNELLNKQLEVQIRSATTLDNILAVLKETGGLLSKDGGVKEKGGSNGSPKQPNQQYTTPADAEKMVSNTGGVQAAGF